VASVVLCLANVSKTFGSVRALEEVDLDVEGGEVRALVGRNGSGKSTLIKILCGYHAPSPGARCEIRGEEVALPLTPRAARRQGLAFVHQDLALINELRVIDNLFAGGFRRVRLGRISWRQERRRAREILASTGISAGPDERVGSLSQVDRALLAIARAVTAVESEGVLVLDEPSGALPGEDVDRLILSVREIARRGVAVVYVTHRLEEVFRLADTVTVLRDGRLVATRPVAQLSEAALVELILGEEALGSLSPSIPAGRGVALSATKLDGHVVKGLDLNVHTGEIVGVTGLNGAGHSEVPYLLFGASKAAAGSVTTAAGTQGPGELTPARSIRQGIILLPGDRQRHSGVQERPVLENVSLPVLARYFRRFWLRAQEERRSVLALLRDFSVSPADYSLQLRQLSGGNQQKALMAKWMQLNPNVVLLHELTQGVDVGAKREILRRVGAAAAQGASVVVASAEVDELANLCHRILVMADGRVVAEIAGGPGSAAEIERTLLSAGTPLQAAVGGAS